MSIIKFDTESSSFSVVTFITVKKINNTERQNVIDYYLFDLVNYHNIFVYQFQIIDIHPFDIKSIIKYQIKCQNSSKKDVNKIVYNIKYTNTNLYPSFLKLDGNNSFSDIIFKLKQ